MGEIFFFLLEEQTFTFSQFSGLRSPRSGRPQGRFLVGADFLVADGCHLAVPSRGRGKESEFCGVSYLFILNRRMVALQCCVGLCRSQRESTTGVHVSPPETWVYPLCLQWAARRGTGALN